jgi:hypothetical protein
MKLNSYLPWLQLRLREKEAALRAAPGHAAAEKARLQAPQSHDSAPAAPITAPPQEHTEEVPEYVESKSRLSQSPCIRAGMSGRVIHRFCLPDLFSESIKQYVEFNWLNKAALLQESKAALL